MNNNFYKDFSSKGFVMCPYTYLQNVGILQTCVLSQILAEFNFATKNKQNFCDDFLINLQRMSKYLGLSIDELHVVLNQLEKIKFIEIFESNIEDTLYLRIYKDNIINFKQTCEVETKFSSWDLGLKYVQNPTHNTTKFTTSTNKIRQFIEEQSFDSSFITMAVYSYLDDLIKSYEKLNKTLITDLPDFWQELKVLLETPKTFVENLINQIEKLSNV